MVSALGTPPGGGGGGARGAGRAGGCGGAGCGANGSVSSLVGDLSGGFVDCCSGDAAGGCAIVVAAKHAHKARIVKSKRKATACTRFIVSPLRVFHPTWFS